MTAKNVKKVSVNQPLYLQIQEIQNTWIELFWAMANGIKSEYDKLKATDILEFWKLFDLWEARLERETKALEAQSRRNR